MLPPVPPKWTEHYFILKLNGINNEQCLLKGNIKYLRRLVVPWSRCRNSSRRHMDRDSGFSSKVGMIGHSESMFI